MRRVQRRCRRPPSSRMLPDMNRSARQPPSEVRLTLPRWVSQVVKWSADYPGDHERMRLVVDLSRENVLHETGGPFAAAVFERDSGRLVAVGLNGVTRLNNSTAHAEIVALMLAQRRLGTFTLDAPGLPVHEIVSSCAPCAMCLGAVLWSGARRLTWAAHREDALAIGFDEGPVFPASLRYLEQRGIEAVPGPLREEAREILQRYESEGGEIYNG